MLSINNTPVYPYTSSGHVLGYVVCGQWGCMYVCVCVCVCVVVSSICIIDYGKVGVLWWWYYDIMGVHNCPGNQLHNFICE